MTKFSLLRLIFFFALIGDIGFVFGQNLAPNYSFDTISTCPFDFGGIGPTVALPWTSATYGSPDILNSCDPGIMGVTNNWFGTQAPIVGEGYAGIFCRGPNFGFEYTEYLQAPLFEPLEADVWYDVSFYVSLAEIGCGIEHIGAYLSVIPPTGQFITALNVTPQIESNQGFLSDYSNWTLISGCFQAQGGEEYITIGNFHHEWESPIDPDCPSGVSTSYYYIENVSVIVGSDPDEIPINFGGPVVECFSFEIDPGIPDLQYTWEDGSHNETLVVTESGTYALTVTDGCNLGIDSVEVTIGGFNEPVEFGVDALTLCNGESYDISLNPDVNEYEWNDGTTGPDYSITTSGVFSVTLDDGCTSSSDAITIIVLDPPAPFELGDDIPLCLGDEIAFDFDPSQGDYVWQDGNTSSSYVIAGSGTYALTISNMCGIETDEIIITELEMPNIELGNDAQVLCDGDTLNVAIDPALGDILWQDGSNLPDYEITTPGLYIVSVTNICGVSTDQIDVTYVDNPAFSFGPDIQLCAGDSLTLDGGGIDGNYIWQDNSSLDSFLVTSPGTYALTISNACNTGVDTVVVAYKAPLIPPDLGPDFTLCPGETSVLYATSPGASYLWQDASSLDSFVVSSSGTYHVQVFDACSSYVDTVSVAINANPPQVDLPAQLTLCQGQSVTLDALIGGVNYLWNDNSINQQLSVSSPGTYSLTVTNACGTDVDTTIILDGGLAPFVELGNNIDLCPGESIVLSPAYSNVNSWIWQDGSTLDSLVVTGATQIFVEVSNACGTAFDTLNTSLLPATPPLDLGADTSLCSGESFVLSINTPGVTILWFDGSTDPDFNVSGTGLVYAAISSLCGQSFDTIQVDALPDIPSLSLGGDQSLCPGEIISLSPGILNVLYEWQDGSTSNSYQSTQAETIILTISNDCGSASDTLEIFESTNGPQVDLGQDILACEGEIITVPAGISGVDFLWQDGSTGADFMTNASGTLILQVSNLCGSDTDTLIVDIHGVPPVVQLGADTSLCDGVSLLLTSTADAETTIAWQDGSSQSFYNVNAPGTYVLTESNHCGNDVDTIFVQYIDAPDAFSLGKDTSLCPGESIVLNAPLTAFNLQWQDGSNQSTIIADQPITYSLQISNECGSQSDSLSVSIDTRTPVVDLDPSISWCEGDIITLDASQSFAATYQWSSGETTPIVQVSSPGVISIDVSTPCSALSQSVDIIPGTDCFVAEVHKDIYIPNVFSPNGDGINDVFTLSYGADLNVTGINGSIFDRWGNLVFTSTGNPFSWDGQFDGEVLKPGVFAYSIKVIYMDGGNEREEVLWGDITLLH